MGPDGQPVGVHGLLLLEGSLEGVQDGTHGEGTHRRPRDGVGGRGEDGVDQLVLLAAVNAGDDVRSGLWGGTTLTVNKLNLADLCFCGIRRILLLYITLFLASQITTIMGQF